jgi:5-methylcytosine-specific restriction endonuclease McrA
MPLPKLQRVRGQDARWLYEIGWNDTDQPPSRGQVRAYQRGRASTFDNQIRLLPGVGLALARLHGVLRPFIQHQWAAKVASLNGLPEADLPRFLFGADRTNLEPVRQGLVELQGGACFYCGGPLRDVHVDHFLPWARHPDDGLANLVAADRICNEQKRDYLASASLLNAWRRRLDDQLPVLGQVAAAAGWEVGEKRTLGAARSLYLPLPEDTRLWAGRGRWVTVEPAQVREALA